MKQKKQNNPESKMSAHKKKISFSVSQKATEETRETVSGLLKKARKVRTEMREPYFPPSDHPAVVRVDPETLDPETRAMYAEARERADQLKDPEYAKEIKRTRLRDLSPFRAGFFGGIGLLLAALLGTMVASLSLVLIYLAVALFIALGLEPIVRRLERKSFPNWLAITTVFILIATVFALIGWVVIPVAISQITSLIDWLPQLAQQISTEDWYTNLTHRFPDLNVQQLINNFQDWIKDPESLKNIFGNIWQTGQTILTGLTGGIFILILTLYFLASLQPAKRGFYALVPLSSRARVIDITEQIFRSVSAYLSGQVTIAFLNAFLGFIMMSIIHVPYTAILAVIVFFLALIPLIGAISATVLVSLVALLNSPTTALIALIYYLIYMQIEAYILTPRIMRRVAQVPGALVVIGALVGATLLGLVGALVAIPVTASLLILIRQVWIPYQSRR